MSPVGTGMIGDQYVRLQICPRCVSSLGGTEACRSPAEGILGSRALGRHKEMIAGKKRDHMVDKQSKKVSWRRMDEDRALKDRRQKTSS